MDYVKDLWGKINPYKPLIHHLIDSGNVCKALLGTPSFNFVIERLSTSMGNEKKKIIPWIQLIVSLHDIGKCHPDFQGKVDCTLVRELKEKSNIRKTPIKGYRHEIFGSHWVYGLFKKDYCWGTKPARTISKAIRGHHGLFNRREIIKDETSFWGELRGEIFKILVETLKPDLGWAPTNFENYSKIGLIISGLIVLSDWIASNEEFFPTKFSGNLENYCGFSVEKANQAVEKLGFKDFVEWPEEKKFSAVWPGFKDLRPIQSICEELMEENNKPGLMIIEAQMGEGKTEAALYVAAQWGAKGLFVALPTAATSNQMFFRVKDFIKDCSEKNETQNVQLVHGMSWVFDDKMLQKPSELNFEGREEGKRVFEWFHPRKRSLLNPFGVGTVDQALMSVLNVRHGFLRLFGLSNKVLIVDEVHAYDAYMSNILTRLLSWCYCLGIPVILLSATLPQQKREELISSYCPKVIGKDFSSEKEDEYPLVTFISEGGELKKRTVSKRKEEKKIEINCMEILNDIQRMAKAVKKRLEEEGCICVLVNTVGSAQKFYSALKEKLDDDTELILFHSRFVSGRRNEIEREVTGKFGNKSLLPKNDPKWEERPKKAVLVATQVVEQSLDLDFDEMFTEIAPIDLILQRLGRVHRHKGRKRGSKKVPVLNIFLPEKKSMRGKTNFGSVEKVYNRFILLKTFLVLKKIDSIKIPLDMRFLIEKVYSENASEGELKEEILKALQEWKRREKDEKNQAAKYLIPYPHPEGFKLGERETVFDEDEDEPASYFNARTRIGSYTERVLLLEDKEFINELSREYPPDKKILKKLYERMANLPQWWLKDLEKKEEEKVPDWLPGVKIKRLKNNLWEGSSKEGKIIRLKNDYELGVIREEVQNEQF